MGILDRLKRAWVASGEDNIAILAAAVAYFAFLAMVPLLATVVLTYGLFADPAMVAAHIEGLAARLPQSAAELIGRQLESMVETSGTIKGLGLLFSLAIALFSARNSGGSLVTAIGIAFNDEKQRNLLRGNALSLAITLGAITGIGVVIAILALTTALAQLLPELSGAGRFAAKLLGLGLLAVTGTLSAAWLFRRVPSGVSPRFRQVLPGALFSSIGLVALTLAFGFYVANVGSYNAVYGSLGAVVVLLTWLFLSAYVLLFGAEIAAVCVQDEVC